MRADDMSIDCPFRLRVLRQDYIHAYIVWFDVRFTKCHKPISFSTGMQYGICWPLVTLVAPFAKYTHWKQTVFYTEDVLCVSEGEEISGYIKAKQNARNHRDWDITIHTDYEGQVNSPFSFHLCSPLMVL